MKLENLHSVYFMGIGGIGMSAIARWFKHMGIPVYGYDKTPSSLTQQLEEEGMEITYEDEEGKIAAQVKNHPENTLIVWTPAIPGNSKQLAYFRENGFDIKKRSQVLGIITHSFYTIAVAGTHGKTTTSSMVAHLLKSAGRNMAAFLGGVTQNYGSNLILHTGSAIDKPLVVVEADEFDRSFLQLHPDIAVVTSVDPDHLDIYGDAEHLSQGFQAFIAMIHKSGKLFIHKKAMDKLDPNSFSHLSRTEYGIDEGEVFAENVKPGIASFSFGFAGPVQHISDLVLNVPGFHNVENALAAIAVVLQLGLSEEEIRNGLLSYRGVKRRFEIVYQGKDRVFIDDYAHHPEEIRAFLTSVKAMYPNRKLTAIFQPHLFTRTRDFAPGFSESLSIADEVVLLDIYPAREMPIEGITSEMLLKDIVTPVKSVQNKADLLDYLQNSPPEVLVTLGAGDIDRLVTPLSNWIQSYDK